MVGVPARRVGWMCQCGVRLKVEAGSGKCSACGTVYREEGGKLIQIDPPEQHG
jgi:UDP-2-acetamido-3-amino-2,3-dideoxy-glucuronate N-acetyltransferase